MTYTPTLLPIVPTSGLYLTSRGHGNEESFIRLFRETWQKIWLRSRRRMVAYWRQPQVNKQFIYRGMSPRIELLWGWTGGRYEAVIAPPDDLPTVPTDSPDGHLYCGSLAVALGEGHILRFRAGVMDFMPESVVCDLIAHELAHVEQWATGFTQNTEERLGRDTPEANAELELDADERIEGWDFSVESIDDWTADVGLTKRITFATAAEYLAYVAEHGTRYDAPLPN